MARRPLPAGETGEMLCRGDAVMPGYWRDPEAGRETFKRRLAAYRRRRRPRAARVIPPLKDRSKDHHHFGGTNIYPREVEEVLLC